MNKKVIYVFIVIIAIIIIAAGIMIIIFSDNSNNNNNIDLSNPSNLEITIKEDNSNNHSISSDIDESDINEISVIEVEGLTNDIIVNSDNTSNDFYYNIDSKNNDEKILLFSVKTSEQINSNLEAVKDMDVELVKEVDGVKYYCITSTGVIVDTENIKEQLRNKELGKEEKASLEKTLKEYNNILKIYEQRDKVINTYIDSK